MCQEGIISCKSKKIEGYIRTIKHSQKGYTLLELAVVLAIAVSLMGVSASGFISARNQFMVDAVAEELASTIREAQNKAIAIEKSNPGVSTKVWGVEINGVNNFKLVPCNLIGSSLSCDRGGGDLSPYPAIDIQDQGGVYFSTPFARANVNDEAITDSNWQEDATSVSREWVPAVALMLPNSGSGDIRVGSGASQKIVHINSKGDVNVE